jgi:tRNA nucleotidyltransferase (CCA-adding enzyme)
MIQRGPGATAATRAPILSSMIPARPAPPELRSERALDLMRSVLPLIDGLHDAGCEAYLVGGGIRDLLLGRPHKDWDIATSATPEAVMALWPHSVPTGMKHGTVTVLLDDHKIEVTTFRSEGPYSDGRHPDWVRMPSTLEEDLSRRDFTVNAFAYDPRREELWDRHHGLEHLNARLLKTVGDPDRRFQEDGLRPIRGIRLAAVLEFTLSPEVLPAMQRARDVVARVAPERLRDELMKLLTAPKPSVGIELLRETGLLDLVLPELLEGYKMPQNRWHAYDVYEHSLRSLDAAPADQPLVRLAALLHDVGKPRTRFEVEGAESEGKFYRHEKVGADLADAMLERLRFSRSEREFVSRLVAEHMFFYRPEWSDATVRRFVRRVGPEHLEALFALRDADDLAHGTGFSSRPDLDDLERRIEGIQARSEALGIGDLAINGEDVMRMLGIGPGPRVGRVLRGLLEHVLEDPTQNERETLLRLCREIGPLLDEAKNGE